MKKKQWLKTAALIVIFGSLIGCDNSTDPIITDPPASNGTTITALDLTHIIGAPVAGRVPIISINTTQYSGVGEWRYATNAVINPGEEFIHNTVYKAVLTLTEKSKYTFTGVAANAFTHKGATSVTNAVDSGLIFITFRGALEAPPGPQAVDALNLSFLLGMPVAGETPQTTITSAQYTGTVEWTETGVPVSGNFTEGAIYKALVTLNVTDIDSYTFTGVGADTFTYSGAASVSNAANSGVVTIVFPAAAASLPEPKWMTSTVTSVSPIGSLNDIPHTSDYVNDAGVKLLALNNRSYSEFLLDNDALNSGNKTSHYYPRIKKMKNGKYIMFYHVQGGNALGESMLGSNLVYSTSEDLKTWAAPKNLFTAFGINSANNGKAININGSPATGLGNYQLTNCDAVVLKGGSVDGWIAAVASFRSSTGPSLIFSTNDANGLAMWISKDNGVTWSGGTGASGDQASVGAVIFRGYSIAPQILQDPASNEIQVYFTNLSTNIQSQIEKWNATAAAGTGLGTNVVTGNTATTTGANVVGHGGTAILRFTETDIDSISANPSGWIIRTEDYEDGKEFYGNTIAQTFYRTEIPHFNVGSSINLYTGQWPAVVRLLGGGIALAAVNNPTDLDNRTISLTYFDGDWDNYEHIGSDSVFGAVKEGPADKHVLWNGTFPYMKQFPSGEIVISYGGRYDGGDLLYTLYSLRIGNAATREFAPAYTPFVYNQTHWGALEPDSSHAMIGVTITKAKIDNDFISSGITTGLGQQRAFLIGRMQLNHTISAKAKTQLSDGYNDEALFVGSNVGTGITMISGLQAQAAVRAAHDENYLYILVDRLDSSLADTDTVNLYLHTGAGALDQTSLQVKAGKDSAQTYRYLSGWTEAPVAGIKHVKRFESNAETAEGGYVAEIAILRSSIDLTGSSVRIALEVVDNGGTADGLPNVNVNNPSSWLTIKLVPAL